MDIITRSLQIQECILKKITKKRILKINKDFIRKIKKIKILYRFNQSIFYMLQKLRKRGHNYADWNGPDEHKLGEY